MCAPLIRLCLAGLLFLSSCSPNSSEEFQKEGEARCRALASVLAAVENRQQLLQLEPQLHKDFEALTCLMIEAREFQCKLADETSRGDSPVSALLEGQLRRIYAIEGGREIIERSQHEALARLDAHERALSKKRAQIN